MLGVYLFTVKTMECNECNVKGAQASIHDGWWSGVTCR